MLLEVYSFYSAVVYNFHILNRVYIVSDAHELKVALCYGGLNGDSATQKMDPVDFVISCVDNHQARKAINDVSKNDFMTSILLFTLCYIDLCGISDAI